MGKLRNRVRLSTTLDLKLWEQLDLVHASGSIPLTRLIDQAVQLLLDHYRQQAGKPKGSPTGRIDQLEERVAQLEGWQAHIQQAADECIENAAEIGFI